MMAKRLLLSTALLTTTACATAHYETTSQPLCVGGTVRDTTGACVLPTTDIDNLGLPTKTTVTNFAPAVLPVIAVIGAAAAVGAAAGGGGDTNGTNGTN